MLLGIDPLLSGSLLKVLDEAGHGDDVLLVDRNYPAYSMGKPVIDLGAVSTTRAARAILSVYPLDTFVERPAGHMEADEDPALHLESHREFLELARAASGRELEFEVVPRFDFYARGRGPGTFAVVRTLDDRPYSCFVLTKGVV